MFWFHNSLFLDVFAAVSACFPLLANHHYLHIKQMHQTFTQNIKLFV